MIAEDAAHRDAADGCGRHDTLWWRTKRGVSGLRPPPGGPHAHTTVTSAMSFQKSLPVVEAVAVEELAQQLDGRRGAVRLERGHVDVVDEDAPSACPAAGRAACFRRLSSRSSIIDCVRAPAEVCAEKELHASHSPPLASFRLHALAMRTDLPTPEPPQKSVGLAPRGWRSSMKAERTVSTVGTSIEEGHRGRVGERGHVEPRR